MVEGFYRGWDELRAVPTGSQSGMRVIVLFTDGCSNSVPGNYEAAPGVVKGFRTYDFPKNFPDPDGQTWDRPTLAGLYDTDCITSPPACSANPSYSLQVSWWNSHLPADMIPSVPLLPLNSSHANHRSSGIPTTFPLQSNTLTVNGVAQNVARGFWGVPNGGRYQADIWNTNNAARNLLEIIANAARSEYPTTGDYPVRVYSIGMGVLLRYNLGTMPELPENILKRIANDRTSPDYNSAQTAGKYYYAQTSADVGAAFQALRSELLRLSK